MPCSLNTKPRPLQRGAALIVSLLILLVMTVIGVTAMQTNVLEEKMAGNYRDTNLAFQAGEAALRVAETHIETSISGLSGFNSSCTNGLCDATAGLSDVWTDTIKAQNALVPTGSNAVDLVVNQPNYWIEGFRVRPAGSSSWKTWYRITARGHGISPNTQVMLQSVYAPR